MRLGSSPIIFNAKAELIAERYDTMTDASGLVLHRTFEHSKEVFVHTNADTVGQAVGLLVHKLSADAIAAHGKFTVALSGGSLPNILNKGLSSIKDGVDFSKWHVFFADERCVPLDHADSNFKACKEALFDHVPVPRDQIYTLDASLSPEAAAVDYTAKLATVWGNELPRFDLLLLGMGPDGHTCSLFPGHPLLQEHKLFVASIEDSPKPPPRRITLTYPVVNNAAHVAFVATGASKAPLMAHMLGLEKRSPPLPAAEVKPTNGVVSWYIDQPAASPEVLGGAETCGAATKL